MLDEGRDEIIQYNPNMASNSEWHVQGMARTVQPVHFEDFDGHQFERLAFAYLLRTDEWRMLEWYGQTGGDGGRDIWGERETGESMCVQCANRKIVTAPKVNRDLDSVVRARGAAPNTFLVICGATVSASMRDKVRAHAAGKGVAKCEIWSGPEFEELLRRDAESLLKRFVQGERFPDDPEELRRFVDAGGTDDQAAIEQIIRVFDRPAFHTPFHHESSLSDFRQAIGDTIQALNTGIWQTRDGKEIGRLPSRHELSSATLRNELAAVVQELIELRAGFEELLLDGEMRPCGCSDTNCPVYIVSPRAAQQMDRLRAQILSRIQGLRHRVKQPSPQPQQTVSLVGSNNCGIIANQVTIRASVPRQRAIVLPGSIGSDPQKYNYVEYLIKRLTKFREAGSSYGQRRRGGPIHPGSTRKILEKQFGGLPKDLPSDRFAEVVSLGSARIGRWAFRRTRGWSCGA